MTLNIDFTPQETDWINAQAKQQGLSPAEIIRKLVDAQLRNTAGGAATATPEPAPTLDAKNAAAIAFLEAQLAADATDDPEEIRQAEAEFEELKRNLNANRAATGERPVPAADLVVATSNVSHISRFVNAELWTNITP